MLSFSEKSYMNPCAKDQRYSGRDRKIGLRESYRRKRYLSQIKKVAKQLSSSLRIELPQILVKGSTVVGMCVPESDLDIAVLVKPSHPLANDVKIWRVFRRKLDTYCQVDFKVESRLVLTNRNKPSWDKISSNIVH